MLCNETKSKHAQFWLAAGKAMEQTLIPVEYVGYGAEYVKFKKMTDWIQLWYELWIIINVLPDTERK